ncbi:MAG: Asp-tRNA(Asn)/Glu-tRNA(Gln) amidotransferase GatCAB subunit B, partial [Thermoflexales bacterium]
QIAALLRELPIAKQRRYQAEYGLSAYDASVLTMDRGIATYFERAVAGGTAARAKTVSNWITTDLFRLMKGGATIGEVKVQPEQLGALIGLIESGTINNTTARSVFEEMYASGADAAAIVAAKGLGQINDLGALRAIVDEVVGASPSQVAQYLAGQEKVLGYLVGQAMKATQGKGNAQVMGGLIREALEAQR